MYANLLSEFLFLDVVTPPLELLVVCEFVTIVPRGANPFSLNMSRTALLACRWTMRAMLRFIYRMTSSR